MTATSAAMKTRWTISAAARLAIPTSSSTASSTAGGTRISASAKRTICPLVERRTAKNSGLRPRMSSSGWASANADRTVS